MKISYNWLKEYINTDLAPEKISELLTDTGLEVEGLEEIETIKGGLKGVVIGEVLTCEQHPNADRLRKTTINIGDENVLDIVCGAPNVAVGQKVVVATVGTIIYASDGEFKIKKSKIRGEVSQGMLCAEDELNLGEGHDGIMVLPNEAQVGITAAEYFNIKSDFVFEIGLTPNRTDAMCHFGVARDLRAALLRYDHKGIENNLPSVASFNASTKGLTISIQIENQNDCYRYAGVSLKNITVGPSPDWIQNRLRAIGIGPINNVVDITNYVLHETGHPLHAFDADTIKGNTIIVKNQPNGTPFITLDEKERTLHQDDLMICDGEGSMVLAGVFGGLHSGVTEATKNVFLESAYFNPVSVRKTAKRHALNTDASFRYERGVDPEMTIYALQRAAILLRDIAGGEIAMDIRDEHPVKITPVQVELELSRMKVLIGQEIPLDLVKSILHSLDIKILSEGANKLLLEIPTYRRDVTREADVVEEILRIYGFNAIEIGSKMHISVAQTDSKSEARYREKMSTVLSGKGFNEIMNNSLTKASYFNGFGFTPENNVTMLNPLSQDLSVMRQTLLFGGLETIARNSNRQRADLNLYEYGKTYQKVEDKYQEKQRLALWMSGHQHPESWKVPFEKSDFFSLKTQVQQILYTLGITDWQELDHDSECLEYGISLQLNQQQIAIIGKVKPEVCRLADVKIDAFYADIDWEYIYKKARKKKIRYSELPKYPEVRRDLALLLNKDVAYADLKKTALTAERKLLKQVNLFDVYEGKNLPENKKSYALSFTLLDEQATLNDMQVDKVMDKIVSKFKDEFAAELR